jgi:hypothetical protein
MALTNTDAGKAFLDQVVAKLPESLRAQAKAVFEAGEAQAALDEAGRGYRSLAETSRLADEAKAANDKAVALYNQNRSWYEANNAEVLAAAALRAKVAELEAGRPAGGDGVPPAAPPVGDDFVRAADFKATVADSVGLFAVTVPRLLRRHERTFGEDLPIEELIAEASKAGLTLERAYDLKYATQLKAKADEARAAEVARIKAEGVAEFRQANPSMPYPSPRAQAGSPLDSLSKGAPAEPNANLVNEAEAFYHELVAKSQVGV